MTNNNNKRICYNCNHGGPQFKISKQTHLHCQHPKFKDEDFESGKTTPWDTLREWWDKCSDFEPKEQKKEIPSDVGSWIVEPLNNKP